MGSDSSLYLINADGSGRTRFTDAPECVTASFPSPEWSPAGDRLACMASTNDRTQQTLAIVDQSGQVLGRMPASRVFETLGHPVATRSSPVGRYDDHYRQPRRSDHPIRSHRWISDVRYPTLSIVVSRRPQNRLLGRGCGRVAHLLIGVSQRADCRIADYPSGANRRVNRSS